MFFRQLNRYRKAFNIDEKIEKINCKCSKQKNDLEDERGREGLKEINEGQLREIYVERLKSLHSLSEQIQIAPEVVKDKEWSYDNRLIGDQLENRLRLYAAQRQSLFVSGVAMVVGFPSLLLSIAAFLVAIFL